MTSPLFRAAAAVLLLLSLDVHAQTPTAVQASPSSPITFGETFTVESKVMGETRRINVYAARGYVTEAEANAPLPVMYMPDGGMQEDFLHVAGLMQVSTGNGTMRPFLLVGIENTERRRDMTGPTAVEADRKIAPRVGGSAAFREFIASELMPLIASRYPVTGETAIVGESLAGLFVVETLLTRPEMFDTYIAFDPSVWWNDGRLVAEAGERLLAHPPKDATIYLANGSDAGIEAPMSDLAASLRKAPGLTVQYEPMPTETHATIYHPAALRAFRTLFKPAGAH
jgi:predicted alpha/beta superfamily hydrolase